MNKKFFKLNVPIGTQIISSRGDYVVEYIPDDAFQYYQNGSTWLGLVEEAVEDLAKLPEEKLQALLLLKQRQGIEADALILEKAIKQKAKPEESTKKRK